MDDMALIQLVGRLTANEINVTNMGVQIETMLHRLAAIEAQQNQEKQERERTLNAQTHSALIEAERKVVEVQQKLAQAERQLASRGEDA